MTRAHILVTIKSGGRHPTEEAALRMLHEMRATTVAAVDLQLPARLRAEVEARLADACAAEAELADILNNSGGDADGDASERETVAVARRLAACQRDLLAFQSPLESTSADATLEASVRLMLDGLRATYARRIGELEEELRLAQGASAARDARLADVRRRAQQAAVWRAYQVDERLATVRENIMVQVDAHLDAFRPFAGWGAQRGHLIAGLKGMLQLYDVLLESRLALYAATRRHFEAAAGRGC
jgi:hypothetical protein